MCINNVCSSYSKVKLGILFCSWVLELATMIRCTYQGNSLEHHQMSSVDYRLEINTIVNTVQYRKPIYSVLYTRDHEGLGFSDQKYHPKTSFMVPW